MRNYLSLLLFFVFALSQGQELNCTVVVNYDKLPNANPQLFKNLEKSISDFVNKTAWTEKTYKDNEKIMCSMFITLNSYDSNNYEAQIQVQASRPVYNSTYTSPILNINDKNFNFNYIEFQNLLFNPNSYDSNLISTLAFYSYIILGVDAETFALDSGSPYFQSAQDIANLGMPSGDKGWSQSEKAQNRFFLISDITSPTYQPYKEAMYQYHFQGLDNMSKNLKDAKMAIVNSIETLTSLQNVRPNSYLVRIFFDAKADEIVSIFTGGPSVAVDKLLENLNKVSNLNASKWSKIKP